MWTLYIGEDDGSYMAWPRLQTKSGGTPYGLGGGLKILDCIYKSLYLLKNIDNKGLIFT